MTAVFRSGDLAIKVIPTAHRSAESVSAEHELLAVLAGRGVPVPEPVALWRGHDATVTVTRYVEHDPSAPIPWEELGRVLRTIHELPLPAHLPPARDRTPVYRRRIENLLAEGRIDNDGAAELHKHLDLEPAPPPATAPVILHGDLHTGNLLRTPAGLAIIDWELACAGGRERDLATLVNRRRRFGVPAADIDAFCAGYGIPDLTDVPAVRALCALKDVGGITYLLSCPGTAQQAEGRRRLATLNQSDHVPWTDR